MVRQLNVVVRSGRISWATLCTNGDAKAIRGARTQGSSAVAAAAAAAARIAPPKTTPPSSSLAAANRLLRHQLQRQLTPVTIASSSITAGVRTKPLVNCCYVVVNSNEQTQLTLTSAPEQTKRWTAADQRMQVCSLLGLDFGTAESTNAQEEIRSAAAGGVVSAQQQQRRRLLEGVRHCDPLLQVSENSLLTSSVRRRIHHSFTVGCQASKGSSAGGKSAKNNNQMDVTDKVAGDPKKISDDEWRERLDKETFKVCRLKGTEYPGSGKYLHHSEKGTYVCVCCRAELFRSEDKFNHCGWPSFRMAKDTSKSGGEAATNVKREQDGTHGMVRTEVLCKQCDSHLGHVFDDGPEPFGTRFCINSVSLDFVRDD